MPLFESHRIRAELKDLKICECLKYQRAFMYSDFLLRVDFIKKVLNETCNCFEQNV